MKHIFTASLLILSTLSFAQTNYNFKPSWKVGEEKQVNFTVTHKEFEGDKLKSNETTTNSAKIKVLKESADSYTLEILRENQVLSSAKEFYEKLDEELKNYKDIKLTYLVNKQTARAELVNWKDAQKFMTESFEQIERLIEKKAPDNASTIKMMFMPTKELFKTQENIDAFFSGDINFILAPFYQNFNIGETKTTTATQENPFNPTLEVSSTTLTTLQSVNEAAKTCDIQQEVQLDLKEFMEMMKGMMRQMSESAGADKKAKDKAEKEINALKMDVKNIQVTTFNYETSWATKVVNTVTIEATDPKKNTPRKRETIATTVVK